MKWSGKHAFLYVMSDSIVASSFCTDPILHLNRAKERKKAEIKCSNTKWKEIKIKYRRKFITVCVVLLIMAHMRCISLFHWKQKKRIGTQLVRMALIFHSTTLFHFFFLSNSLASVFNGKLGEQGTRQYAMDAIIRGNCIL